MKRILCILSSLDAGGAETFVMKVSRILCKKDCQIDFIVSKEGGCYTQEVLDRGGRIYVIPQRSQKPLAAFHGIFSVVRNNGYHSVIKLGESSLAVVDLLAARFGGAKNVALRACNAPTNLSFLSKSVHRLLLPLSNCVANVKISPSMLAAEFLFGKRAAYKDVQLLNNGVDLDVFHFDAEGRMRIRDEFSLGDCLVVGHIGRFHVQKNHGYLLKVFKKIRDERSDAKLLLVGVGEKEAEIRQQIRFLGLEDAVIFTGTRFDVPQLLSAMDVFVFPSLHEGMPNTVIEAQATGLPCVIADTITSEADITGLVTYMSLESTADAWAQCALSLVAAERKDTHQDFIAKGYDIQSVAQRFVELICG